MSTQLFLRYVAVETSNANGARYSNLVGSEIAWRNYGLSTTRGTGTSAASLYSPTTVAGPTNGLELGGYGGSPLHLFISPPLAADVTISGSITFNVWAYESSMSANAAINVRVFKYTPSGVITEVIKTSRTTELGTSSAAQNWSESPPSGVAFARGDRIGVAVFADDAGTMGSGYDVTATFNRNTASVDGDTYITTTETLSFESAPSGTYIYPTATSAGINPGSATELQMWTSRGSGYQSLTSTSFSGWSDPVQVIAGGTAYEWYTKQLQATTLSGPILFNSRALVDYPGVSYSAAPIYRAEIAVVDADGSNPVVFGWGGNQDQISSKAETEAQTWISGDDIAVTDGQRIRLRVFVDDVGGGGEYYSASSISSGYSATFRYAGTSSGGSGDTYLRFSSGVTFTEYSGGTTVSSDFDLDAILRKTIEPTGFTLNAWIVSHVTEDFTLDANIFATVVPEGGFKLDAFIVGTGYGYFEVSSILRKTMADDFTADAIARKTINPTFAVDAHIAWWFTLDAFLLKTITPTPFPLDAQIDAVHAYGSFTLDAVLKRRVLNGTDVVTFSGSSSWRTGTGRGSASYTDLLVGDNISSWGSRGWSTGQWHDPLGGWDNYEDWYAWPAYNLMPGWTIDEAVLALGANEHPPENDFVIEVYLSPWRGLNENTYYLWQPEIDDLTLVATFDTVNYATNALNYFTSVALAENISTTLNPSATGWTELAVVSQNFRLGVPPSTDTALDEEYVEWNVLSWELPVSVIILTISGGTPFTLDAWIGSHGSFVLDAEIAGVGEKLGNFELDASILGLGLGSLTLDAWLYTAGGGFFTLNALISTTRLFGTDTRTTSTVEPGERVNILDESYPILLQADINNQLATGLWVGGDIEVGQWIQLGYEDAEPFANGEWASRLFTTPRRQGETFVSSSIRARVKSDDSDTDFVIEVRQSDWQGYPVNTEYVNQATFAALPLLATLDTSGISVGYNTFTITGTGADYFSTTGVTSWLGVIFGSSRYRTGSEPDGAEYVLLDLYTFPTSYPLYLDVTVSRETGITLDAEISPSRTFTVDAWIGALGTKYGNLKADAILRKTITTGFTLDAFKAFKFTIDAYIGWWFSIDALIVGPVEDTFSVDAEIAPQGFSLDAVVRRTIRDLFVLEALISRNTITLDAEIGAGGQFTLSALLVGPKTGSFTLDAWIFAGTHQRYFTADAVLLKNQWRIFTANAQLVLPHVEYTGSATVDAVCLDFFSDSFVLDAEIDSGYRSSTFTLDADILGASEQRGDFTLDAFLFRTNRDLFTLEALIAQGMFRLDAMIGWWFSLDAQIEGSWSDSFTLDANIAGTFTLDAIVRRVPEVGFTLDAFVDGGTHGWFTLDALVVGPRDHEPPFTLDATIYRAGTADGFTLDAQIAGWFTLDAWIAREDGGLHGGMFSLEAYIYSNEVIIWPDEQSGSDGSTPDANTFTSPSATFNEGMVGSTITIDGIAYTIVAVIDEHTITITPVIEAGQSDLPWEIQPDAVDPNGNPIPDWFKGKRKFRILITVAGVDVTGDVIWSQTKFSQHAKTNPGTFELVLEGTATHDGGEEILVYIDDFRAFGGYVLAVERGYAFSSHGPAITTLRGADFNVLFDKLIVYNTASADDPRGTYIPYKSFAKGSLDTKIINKVFSSYVDLPAGFNYTDHVESVGVAALEKPWAMPQSGSPLRQVMQSISQVTNAVWWIDPYLKLHYGSRSDITAPYPITDGLGGISSREVTFQTDLSKTVTEAILWGALSRTTEGEIMVAHDTSDNFTSPFGPLQYAEWRQDLHHRAYINRRTASILERYGQPINRAKVVIYEPGYQAGQVADVRLSQHNVNDALVIRELQLSFAVMKERSGDLYYGVPKYSLTIGLDPEEPWDIYDYLPFPDDKGTPYPRRWKRDDCDPEIEGVRFDSTSGGFTPNISFQYPPSYHVQIGPVADWNVNGLVPVIEDWGSKGWTDSVGELTLQSRYGGGALMYTYGPHIVISVPEIWSNQAWVTVEFSIDGLLGDVELHDESSFARTGVVFGMGEDLVYPDYYWVFLTDYTKGGGVGQLNTQRTIFGANEGYTRDPALPDIPNVEASSDQQMRAGTHYFFSARLDREPTRFDTESGELHDATRTKPACRDWIIVPNYDDTTSNTIVGAVGPGQPPLLAGKPGGGNATPFSIEYEASKPIPSSIWDADCENDYSWHFRAARGYLGIYLDLVTSTWYSEGEGWIYDVPETHVTSLTIHNVTVSASPDREDICADDEGEIYGAVTDGWGCETIQLLDAAGERVLANTQPRPWTFTTTGIVSRGTLTVYDADRGELLHDDIDWDPIGSEGKVFRVNRTGTQRVIACYRNYIVNVRSEYSTPRDVTQSPLRTHPIPT